MNHSVNQSLLSIGFPLCAAAHSLRVALELVQAVGDFRLELQDAPFAPGALPHLCGLLVVRHCG
jgi:hypothetical protein